MTPKNPSGPLLVASPAQAIRTFIAATASTAAHRNASTTSSPRSPGPECVDTRLDDFHPGEVCEQGAAHVMPALVRDSLPVGEDAQTLRACRR